MRKAMRGGGGWACGCVGKGGGVNGGGFGSQTKLVIPV